MSISRFTNPVMFIISLFFIGFAGAKPNIIMIMTDDQGYGDLSIHGNPIVKTPHLDALAKNSTRLDNYHVSPTCAPTRAALMTGHVSNRTGVWHTVMGRSLLRTDERTLADYLQDGGYQTAMVGKWHLGDNYPYRPHDRGFQHAYYHGAGGVGQTPDYWDNSYFDDVYFRNGAPEQSSGFVTDVLFEEAINYINEFKQQDAPFFVYLSTNAPHGPMHAPKAYADLYKDAKIPTKIQHFFGMISNIDDNVAKLREYLEKNNMTENTLLMFTTDNGTSAGHKVYSGGMRGQKGSEYDGGHRVPMFIHWPAGGLNKHHRIDNLAGHVDMVPTLLDLANIAPPKDVKFDGKSLKPLLMKQSSEWSERVMITDSQRVYMAKKWRKSSVMTQRWRLINGVKLYDMGSDPLQATDVAKQHPEVVASLRNEYDSWWESLTPSLNKTSSLYVGDPNANPVTLTSHDWLGHNAAVPWNQRQIRRATREEDGIHKSFWQVDVRQAGIYRFTLRRWPEEIDHPISAELKKGEVVAGDKAFRAVKGVAFDAKHAVIQVQGQQQKQKIAKGAKSVDFTLTLSSGITSLKAYFENGKKQQLGSYFVTVERLESK